MLAQYKRLVRWRNKKNRNEAILRSGLRSVHACVRTSFDAVADRDSSWRRHSLDARIPIVCRTNGPRETNDVDRQGGTSGLGCCGGGGGWATAGLLASRVLDRCLSATRFAAADGD